jgi:uncharacterized protein YbbC (DUF1343 family)
MLKGVDTLVVDLQDIGSRFWTYPTTMEFVVEEAARHRLRVVVLDRPNPIGGIAVEGPMQDASAVGFTGYVTMPIRHGLTMGELARLFNGERRVGAELTVVPMQHWRRDAWLDETGVAWVSPSPNMRNLIAATLYPGLGAIEQTNVSVGRGTDTPFEQVGAPWIDGAALASALNARAIPGVSFYPVAFTPAAGAKFAGERCSGVFIVVTDRDALRPVRVGVEVASALSKAYGSTFTLEDAATQLGSKSAIARIRAGDDPVAIVQSFADAERAWRATRQKYLLYE